MGKTSSKSKSSANPSSVFMKGFENMFSALNQHVTSINSSKLFAGLMIIVLNISTKYVNMNLPKTVESYLKYTFSKQILVFAIAWMGTRDIYIALIITTIFIICIDFLFNEKSSMCILPETFVTEHMSKMEDVTEAERKNAKEVLEKADKAAKKVLESNENITGAKESSPFF